MMQPLSLCCIKVHLALHISWFRNICQSTVRISPYPIDVAGTDSTCLGKTSPLLDECRGAGHRTIKPRRLKLTPSYHATPRHRTPFFGIRKAGCF